MQPFHISRDKIHMIIHFEHLVLACDHVECLLWACAHVKYLLWGCLWKYTGTLAQITQLWFRTKCGKGSSWVFWVTLVCRQLETWKQKWSCWLRASLIVMCPLVKLLFQCSHSSAVHSRRIKTLKYFLVIQKWFMGWKALIQSTGCHLQHHLNLIIGPAQGRTFTAVPLTCMSWMTLMSSVPARPGLSPLTDTKPHLTPCGPH